MTHLPSPATLVTVAVAALLGAAGLLALQIVLGLEYTEGGTTGTRASMVGAMVTLALLPVFLAFAWRCGARPIAAAIGISFAALLVYSLPATTGRTGEIKEAKATVADDVASWRAEHAENAKQFKWAVPDRNAECAGAPDPLPPNGWPNCRRKTGTVTALQERQAKLEADIKAAGTAATGDLGSTLWAWALSRFGMTADAIRKGSVLAFAVGLDFAIWSLIALSEFLVSRALAIRRALKATALRRMLRSDLPGPDGSANGPPRADRPVGGTKPKSDRPKPSAPEGPAAEPDGRTDGLQGRVLAFIHTERALGRTIPRQADIAERFDMPRSTLSDWMAGWEADGSIPVRWQVGRCKVIAAE